MIKIVKTITATPKSCPGRYEYNKISALNSGWYKITLKALMNKSIILRQIDSTGIKAVAF